MKKNYQDDDEGSNHELLKNKDGINQTSPTGDDNGQQARKKKIIKWSVIGAIVTIIVVLAIVLPIVLTKDKNKPDPPGPTVTPVVPGYNPYSADPTDVKFNQADVSGLLRFKDSVQNQDQHDHQIRKLNPGSQVLLADDAQPLGVDSKQIPKGDNNKLSTTVKFAFDMQSYKVAHLMMADNDHERFQIPSNVVPNAGASETMRLDMVGFSYNLNPFSFSFTDATDKSNVLLTTENQTLVFMDKFIQVDFLLPSQRIYGFGERMHDFQLSEGTFTMWASGRNQVYDDAYGRKGLYGVHPFILVQGKNKDDYIGLFFKNANAQSPVIKYKDDKAILSYITIGGQLDVYFFVHGSAKEIIQSYQTIIGGKINLPPFWALGWQQASQKYQDTDTVMSVIDQYQKAGLPLDAIHLDTQYLKDDFQVDTDKFDFTKLSQVLQQNKVKLLLQVPSSIASSGKYYDMGKDSDAFIKSGLYKEILLSEQNGRKSVFPDWTQKSASQLWVQGLKDLYAQVSFDGLVFNQNEPFTDIPGEIKQDTPSSKKLLQSDNYNWYGSYQDQSSNSTFFVPFVPGYSFNEPSNVNGNWDNLTISLNATHANGFTEYDMHSLYGLMMSGVTYENFLYGDDNPNKNSRQFLMSRSTFASSGRFASHWTGDNERTWDAMRYSIASLMSFNMFGIPHVGADVCGYLGSTLDDELCARWIQLAMFYPLARSNQNDMYMGVKDGNHEPYTLNAKYKQWVQDSIGKRYSYLRHMYTCLFEVSQWGGSCIDPVFYYYPYDDNLHNDHQASFMVGGALLVTPVLEALGDKETFDAYFPQGQWVNLHDNDFTVVGDNSKGSTVHLNAQQSTVNVHLRPGGLIPWQDNRKLDVKNTDDLLNRKISLVANRDTNGHAYGTLFLDTGSSLDEITLGNYEYYQINVQANSVQMFFGAGNRGSQKQMLDQVILTNSQELKNPFACYMDHEFVPHKMDITYLPEQKLLRIAPLADETLQFNQFQAIHFGGENDLNLCEANTYQYVLADKSTPIDLKKQNVTIVLNHSAGILPQIEVYIRVIYTEIVNVKWSWKLDSNGKLPAGVRQPFHVPDDFITTDNVPEVNITVDQFISITTDPYFQINFKYRSVDNPSIMLAIKGMIYDQFLNMIAVNAYTTSGDDFHGVFGLGERANKDFFFQDGVYSMHSRDQPTPEEDGKSPGKNMYGTHPIFIFKHKPSTWVGVLYKLANSQDWYVKNDQASGTVSLKTLATGGIVDMYVWIGNNPDGVVQKYYQLIGKPVLIPQWAYGWHQCRWGYTDLEQLKNVTTQYDANKIPLDVQWSDIDYLQYYRDFEYDHDRFKELPDFIDQLHNDNRYYVPILDAGLAYRKDSGYSAFDEALKDSLFIKIKDEPFISQVWPNDAAFPDYFNPKTPDFWKNQLTNLHKQIGFDGLWEDMNEASNFCTGVCYAKQAVDSPVQYNLRYTPTQRNLEVKSIALDAYHYDGSLQLDTHNIYGIQEVQVTDTWFKNQDKRTFIIDRSSFAGMGKFGSRWLGDNFSDVKFMGYSVSGVMLMQVFGIQFTGSDVCGFIGDTTPELCARWHVVGSFYPFSRNHNNWGQIPQEPYVFGDQEYEPGHKYQDIMRDAIRNKYQLIPYYYTSMTLNSLSGTGTFYKPLFFEFPEDQLAYKNITSNVMLGYSLKASFQSESLDQNKTWFYFPKGTWCDIYKPKDFPCFTSDGEAMELSSKAYDYYLHIRQGSVVPLHDLTDVEFKTSKDLQSRAISLYVLGELRGDGTQNWDARGVFYNDDGLTLDTTNKANGYSITARLQNNKLTMNFYQTMNATDYYKSDTGCSAVNQNDYFSTIYFYNAEESSLKTDYTVTMTLFPSQQQLPAGTATLDKDRNLLVFKADKDICMSTIYKLDFTPK